MTRPIDQLFEASSEASARDLLERTQEIARLDDRARVPLQVRVDAFPEEIVAELRAKHVQDERAFFVEVAIEEIERRVVVLTHHGAAITSAGFSEVGGEIGGDAVLVFVT